MSLLELRDVRKDYIGGALPERTVLCGADLSVSAGETLAITGPSGSGKTTLLNIIGLLDSPTSGSVLLDGQDVSALNASQQARLRSERIGFVFQQHHLLPQCTVLENVLVPTLARAGRAPANAVVRARSLLSRVGLSEHEAHRPGELSGGQRQRVAVARALINEPALLLADEPTGSLDQLAARELSALLLELSAQRKMTLIVATHWMELATRMERRLELSSGRLARWEA